MKTFKIIIFLVLGYAATVVLFESWLGYSQPAGRTTLRIITTDEHGAEHERVLSRIDDGGSIYVSANHWPRRWYKHALARPEVTVKIADNNLPFRATPVVGDENARLQFDHKHKLSFRLLTGFPPRYFLRLDPS